jgi:adenylate cyclase class 2
LEVEVKIPCADLSAVRSALEAEGGVCKTPRHFESNDLYDDAGRNLASQGRTIRIRRAAGRSILTFKGPPRFQHGIKTREERETDVSDAAETEAILGGLGLERRFRYEKWREDWTHDGSTISLDETPIGRFVEIEGDPPQIRRLVQLLGLDFTAALPYSYARLYRDRRQKDSSLPPDMTFPLPERPPE